MQSFVTQIQPLQKRVTAFLVNIFLRKDFHSTSSNAPKPPYLARVPTCRNFWVFIWHAGSRIRSAQSDGRIGPSWPLSLLPTLRLYNCTLGRSRRPTTSPAGCRSQLFPPHKNCIQAFTCTPTGLPEWSGRTYENDNS